MAALNIAPRDVQTAIEDLVHGLAAWRLWLAFSSNDIKYRYRRSTLGPFWATISMAVVIFTTAFVLSFLFGSRLERFLPYICINLILWNHLTLIVNEGAASLINSSALILQVKRPFSVYIWQSVARNLILAAHTMVVFFIVAFAMGLWPNWQYFLAIPGLSLYIANVGWMAAMCAVLSARFRDLPLITTNAFTVLFWLTPILYEQHQVKAQMKLINDINPFTHIMAVSRMPFLLEIPSETNWLIAAVTAVIGWGLFVLLYARARKRIPYWL